MFRSSLLLSLALSICAPGCGGDAPPADAPGADAPALDAAVDAPVVTCARDADCDDGLFCTGVERCEGSVCVRGDDPCDDGIACTVDSCTESRMRCRSEAPDEDGDGAGDATCVDAGGTPLGDDCDDDDAARYPGAVEVCDGDDEDCSDTTLGGVDDDHDGYVSRACCNGASCGNDCDDARLGSFPGATEVCDGLDQDCDGMADDGLILDGFRDEDGDGWGGAMATRACPGSPGFDTRGGDCNDDPTSADARAQSPGLVEVCDGIRNDCAALAADVGAGTATWYVDGDGDGFGSAASGSTTSCAPVAGSVLLGTDCNDAASAIHPGALEQCNAIDDDCDGARSFRIGTNDFEDDDLDGLADVMCPGGGGTDCSDADPLSGPGETEVCDLRDNDCDTRVDEGAPTAIYYRDVDRDGHGALASGSVVACTPVLGYVLSAGDCNDMDADRHPGATETCDSADEDCDAAIDEAPASDMCSLPSATSYCLAGRCFVDACDVGHRDCDARPENGCEVDVRVEAFNCGGCGVTCPGLGSCGGGICIHSQSSIASEAGWPVPRPIEVTIDTPEPGATVVYSVFGGDPTDGSGFFDQTATTPFTVTLPGGIDSIRWHVVHGPGLFEEVQYASATLDGATQTRVGALIEGLDIDGSGPVAAVAPGASVRIAYHLQRWHGPAAVDEGAAFLFLGNSATPRIVDCTVIPRTPYPGISTDEVVTFTAPTTPGVYPFSLITYPDGACMSLTSLLGPNDIGWLIVGR